MKLAWHPLWAYGTVAVAMTAAPRVFPAVPGIEALLVVLVLLSAACVFMAGRLREGRGPWPWYVLGAGMTAWAAGDATWLWHAYATSAVPPVPSPADIGYLAAVPCFALALHLFERQGRPTAYRMQGLDLAIVALGAAGAAWTLIGNPARSSDDPTIERVMLAAYPALDVLLLALVFRAMLGATRRTPLTFIAIGMMSLVVADMSFAALVLGDTYTHLHPLGAFWQAGFAMMGAGALLECRSDDAVPATVARQRPHVLLGWILLSALAVPCAAYAAWLRGLPLDISTTFAATIAMVVLIVVRLWALVLERDAASRHLELLTIELRDARDRLDLSSERRGMLLRQAEQAMESERLVLAAAIHDGPVQSLAALLYEIELLRTPGRATVDVLAETVTERIRHEVDRLRSIMTELRPAALDERGVVAAIEDYAGRALDPTTRLEIRADLPERIPPSLEVRVYRIVQESLANVSRHARASHVQLRIEHVGRLLRLDVVDDGVGFDVGSFEAGAASGHFGLLAMRERVELAGGAWGVISTEGEGTTVSAQLPVEAGP